MGELIRFAFTGFNVVTSVLLILVLIYWIIMILGVIDFDLFDFDLDFDLDGIEDMGPLEAVLAFFNVSELPFMLVFSVLILIFWILSMLLHQLPVTPGGLINHLLLLPAFVISLLLTKVITNPMKKLFRQVHDEENQRGMAVIGQLVVLNCDLYPDKIGQAELKRDGASILVNVKPEFEGVTFQKNEEAYVTKKDEQRDLYYIVKLR